MLLATPRCASPTIPASKHGPLLLPSWAVTKDFHANNKNWCYIGECLTAKLNPVGQHAMLVVGSRSTRTGELRLLLQNWWRHKQFVEVDEEYYNSCMVSRARFVDTPQPHIPPQLDTTNAVFSVSTVDGAGVAGVGCGPTGPLRRE